MPEFNPFTIQVFSLSGPLRVSEPSPPMMLLREPPVRINSSCPVPPTRDSIPVKPSPTPVTVPAFSPVNVQVFFTLSAVNVFFPPLPSILPVRVPPLNVKSSSSMPPTRFSIPLNPPWTPVTVPAFLPVNFQVFFTSSPVSESSPSLPSMLPSSVPPSRRKSSW